VFRSKSASFVLIFCVAVGASNAADTPQKSVTPLETAKLGAFLGQWESEGKDYETVYGHARQITSKTSCNWSANGGFLICDQINQDSTGTSHNQLTVYAYNKKDGTYTYSTFQDAGAKPFTGTLKIEGNVWTYSGGNFEQSGKKVRFQTVNVFTSSSVETFKVEFSENDGPWTTSGEGTSHKVWAKD
jgi:Protein of unknown function (DUF1579)